MREELKHQGRPASDGETYEFGPYRLDTCKRVLSASGEITLTISLTPRAMDLLIKFVTSAGEPLDKNGLLDELWPNAEVYEHTLSQHVFMLRRVLGNGYIQTVPGRGYRFVAPVRAVV